MKNILLHLLQNVSTNISISRNINTAPWLLSNINHGFISSENTHYSFSFIITKITILNGRLFMIDFSCKHCFELYGCKYDLNTEMYLKDSSGILFSLYIGSLRDSQTLPLFTFRL